MRVSPGVIFAAVVWCWPSLAGAQPGTTPGTFELAGGLRWTGRVSGGVAEATETNSGGNRFRLFVAQTTMDPAPGIEGSLSRRLMPRLDAGLVVSFASSTLRTRLTADFEGIPDTEAIESMLEVSLEGAVVLHLPQWRIGRRAVPIVSAGGGYLRQLHEGRTLLQSGAVYRGGIGLDYLLGEGATSGLRVEFRAVVKSGGTTMDGNPHVAPALSVLWFSRF